MEDKLIASGVFVAEQEVLKEKQDEDEYVEEYGEYEVHVTKPENADSLPEETVIASNMKKVQAASNDLPKYYVVQNGDTLSSISFKMYNSVGYVAELMEANGFGEADEIHEGDRIMIPTVN